MRAQTRPRILLALGSEILVLLAATILLFGPCSRTRRTLLGSADITFARLGGYYLLGSAGILLLLG